jgi:hypothetical protein
MKKNKQAWFPDLSGLGRRAVIKKQGRLFQLWFLPLTPFKTGLFRLIPF